MKKAEDESKESSSQMPSWIQDKSKDIDASALSFKSGIVNSSTSQLIGNEPPQIEEQKAQAQELGDASTILKVNQSLLTEDNTTLNELHNKLQNQANQSALTEVLNLMEQPQPDTEQSIFQENGPSEMAEVIPDAVTEASLQSEHVDPREYQREIFRMIAEQWGLLESEQYRDDPCEYGSIVFMATGSGKTFVAIMLILQIFDLDPYTLVKMTDKQLQAKREIAHGPTMRKKKVAFLVPTTNLVEQQADAIDRFTPMRVGKYSGNHQKSQKSLPGEKQAVNWKNQLQQFDVFVFTEKKLYDTLKHGFLKIEDFDMIVFDECHHADQSHFYNLIMSDFFYYKYDKTDEIVKRPRILGLTASPIKQKVGDCFVANVSAEIKEKLQNLANNLFSKFVCISPDQIKALESQQVSVIIEKYEFDITEKVRDVQEISENLIKKLCMLIPINENSIALNGPGADITCDDPDHEAQQYFANSNATEKMMCVVSKLVDIEFKKHQDEQVVKFLKKRQEFINVDMNYIKTNIHINSFQHKDDQIILIFSIIVLKNANNLILELGPYSFMRFLKDISEQLLESIPNGSDKAIKANEILTQFNLFSKQVQKDEKAQVVKVSKKVEKLISLLNKFAGDGKKIIIFVKDRVVAEYLKKILQKQIEIQQNLKNTTGETDTKLLSLSYRVDMAMGPQGKNLINKAYRSTKSTKEEANDNSTEYTNDPDMDSEFSHIDQTIDTNSSQQSAFPTINKAMRTKELLKFRSNIQSATQHTSNLNSVKMSNNQLKEVLQKFRTGVINTLIATNVVEEGLDVSQCNLVICMNELLNVKAFIQMKGRARQKDSKFIFLCANQEFSEVEKDKKNFGVVIDQMKELAFGKDSIGGIEPEEDILKKRAIDESDFFEIEKTGARVSLRDAKSVLETFCKAAADCVPIPQQPESPEENEQDDASQASKKPSKYVKDYEPYYHSKETTSDEHNRKHYLSFLYFPKTCGPFVNNNFRVLCKSGFIKKKDSENHVAMEGLKILYKNGFLDDHLFPKIGQWSQSNHIHVPLPPGDTSDSPQTQQVYVQSLKKKKNKAEGMIGVTLQNVPPGNTIKKRAQISENEMEEFKNEQKEFEKELKCKKSRHFETVEASFRSLIKEKLDTGDDFPKIYIHCLKGQDGEASNGFPFKTSKDHLGIIYNRNFEQSNSIRFWMFQEKKQKDKNKEYLSQLLKNEIIDEDTFDTCLQDKDIIELELNHKNLVEIDFKQICQGDINECRLRIQKLKFFHTWIFYYFYCADHKFIKHVLKYKFSFTFNIFGELLAQIFQKKNFLDNIKAIYSPNKSADEFQHKYKQQFKESNMYHDQKLLEVHPFIVPITENNYGKLEINWALINKVIKYVNDKILDIIFMKRGNFIHKNLDLQDNDHKKYPRFTKDSVRAKRKNLLDVWDDQFTGVRYVKLEQFQATHRWNEPILHLEKRNKQQFDQSAQGMTSLHQSQGFGYQLQMPQQRVSLIQNFKETTDPSNSFSNNHKDKSQRYQECANRDQRLDIYTIQMYNYEKNSLFLNPLINTQLFVVRKERHFVDFSKTPKQEQNFKQPQATTEKLQRTQVASNVSSKFDVPQQLIKQSPLSYDQYQVFQQSCTHLLYFNEFLQVEKFIHDKFSGLKCYLTKRDKSKQNAQLKKHQFTLNLTIDQVISQQKENLSSDKQPAFISRDVFRSPDKDGTDDKDRLKDNDVKVQLATDQLLNNIDLIMEALTAPNANRNYDYERLEFYGDSVISFLVILELFLTKNYTYKEGPLDFYRIQQVSNMRFYKVNVQHVFYKYMINEPQTIFNDFVPGAFEDLHYQERIKHKTLNELNNKIKELRKFQIYIQHLWFCVKYKNSLVLQDNQFMDQLRRYFYEQQTRKNTSFADDQIYTEEIVFRQEYYKKKWGSDEVILHEYSKQLESCIKKISDQKEKKIEDIETNLSKIKDKRQNNQKMFFFKQLADVVESVTGAATVACGLNLTQNYLRTIQVLQHPQDILRLKLRELKSVKENNKESMHFLNFQYNQGNLKLVEKKFGYTFRNKIWLLEAMTHKSYMDTSKPVIQEMNSNTSKETIFLQQKNIEEQAFIENTKKPRVHLSKEQQANDESSISDLIEPHDDYERLEFLGDSILNFLIAEHFYRTTVNDKEKKMPKELHKMKTSVINNALLSLITIENGIHEHVLYNNKAISFKEQFDKYVAKVHELLAGVGSTKEQLQSNNIQALDLDQLYEYNLKIFGDVFESLIGAVFIDSESIETTWSVLHKLMEPYIKIYANLETLQDHSRTKLLELWNQKPFMRNLKCSHETQKAEGMESEGTIIFKGMVDKECVLEVPYHKDAKNKVRIFYKHYYTLMNGFFSYLEKRQGDTFLAKEKIVKMICDYRDKHFKIQTLEEIDKEEKEQKEKEAQEQEANKKMKEGSKGQPKEPEDPELKKAIEQSLDLLFDDDADDEKPENNAAQPETNLPDIFKEMDTTTMFGQEPPE